MESENILDSNLYEENPNIEKVIEKIYPRLVERFKAMIFDGFIILFIFFISAWIFGYFENAPTFLRVGVFVLIFFLYEPLMISLSGGTFGHKAMDLQVKSNSDEISNIYLPTAIIRAAIKWFLGWLSFLTILADKKNRSIHDFLSNSVVIYKV